VSYAEAQQATTCPLSHACGNRSTGTTVKESVTLPPTPLATHAMLTVGLLGFDDARARELAEDVGRAAIGGVHWRTGPFRSADAWLVNGARVRIQREDEIEVDGGTEAPVRLQLSNVDRPVAFATPLPSEFEPACTFDPHSFSSLTVALAKFASWLRPNLMLLQVADVLVHKYASLKRSQVYHLMADARLLGVVDLKGDVGVAPQTTSTSLGSVIWQPRPASAGYVPESFARRSTRLLLWEYAAHASHDALPRRYRSSRLYLRHAPMLPQSAFSDSQLLVVRELSREPLTLDELCARSTAPQAEIERALTALYLVGSITSSAQRAQPKVAAAEPASSWPSWLTSQMPNTAGWLDVTAPGALPAAPVALARR
jgi:hypothetical protein